MKCQASGCVNGKVILFTSVVDCEACGGSGIDEYIDVGKSLKNDLIDSDLYHLIKNPSVLDTLEQNETFYNTGIKSCNRLSVFCIKGFTWKESSYYIDVYGDETHDQARQILKILEKHFTQ